MPDAIAECFNAELRRRFRLAVEQAYRYLGHRIAPWVLFGGDQKLEAAVDKAVAARADGAGRSQPPILHKLLAGGVAHRVRWPDHPGEHDILVGPGLHRALEVGDLAVRQVVPPIVHETGGAV